MACLGVYNGWPLEWVRDREASRAPEGGKTKIYFHWKGINSGRYNRNVYIAEVSEGGSHWWHVQAGYQEKNAMH